MYLVEANQGGRVVVIHLTGVVTAAEVKAGSRQLEQLLQDAEPGFAVLADFRGLETMKPETSPQIARVMDLLAGKGVGIVVRVMPDACKDVGLNILSHFHYGPGIKIATVPTMAQAIALLLDEQ